MQTVLWIKISKKVEYSLNLFIEDYDYEEEYYDEESGSGEEYYDEYSGGYGEDYEDYEDGEESGDLYEYETKYYFIPYCHKHKGELWTLSINCSFHFTLKLV